MENSAVELHRRFVEKFVDRALAGATCRRWIRQFRDNDFDVRIEEHGKPPKMFEHA